MKDIAIGAVSIIAIIGIAVLGVLQLEADEERRQEARGMPAVQTDDSVARGNSWKVSCATVDGGTATSLLTNVDGGAYMGPVTDLTIGSDSATCVRVGVDGIDSSHGARVGFGCRAGGEYPLHAKAGECRSEGAAVVVDVSGARP